LKNFDEQFYWPKLKLALSNLIESFFQESTSPNRSINIFCYGLGSIDDQFSSRYQFALLLLIVDEFKEMTSNLDTSCSHVGLKVNSVELYDPVFTQTDKKLLEEVYSFKVESINTKCMKQIDLLSDANADNAVLNLFYMPHCGKALYNNLLFSNWSINNLNKLMILGNSFNTMVLNTLEKVMLQNYSFIKDSIQFVSETKLDNSCELTNAFYDFSLHVFKLRSDDIGSFSLQNKLDLDWHANRPEPVYDENYSLFFQLIHYWLYKFHGIQL